MATVLAFGALPRPQGFPCGKREHPQMPAICRIGTMKNFGALVQGVFLSEHSSRGAASSKQSASTVLFDARCFLLSRCSSMFDVTCWKLRPVQFALA